MSLTKEDIEEVVKSVLENAKPCCCYSEEHQEHHHYIKEQLDSYRRWKERREKMLQAALGLMTVTGLGFLGTILAKIGKIVWEHWKTTGGT